MTSTLGSDPHLPVRPQVAFDRPKVASGSTGSWQRRPVVVSDDGRIDGEMVQRLPAQRVTGYEPLSGFAVDTVAAVTLESGARAVFKAAAAREVEVEPWALRSMAEGAFRSLRSSPGRRTRRSRAFAPTHHVILGASSTGDLP
jgi:hypothetical protein